MAKLFLYLYKCPMCKGTQYAHRSGMEEKGKPCAYCGHVDNPLS